MLSRAIKLGACILQTFTGMVNAMWSTKKCTPSWVCLKMGYTSPDGYKKWGKLWLTLGFRHTLFSSIPSTGPLFSLTFDGHILALKKTFWGVLRYYPWGLLHVLQQKHTNLLLFQQPYFCIQPYLLVIYLHYNIPISIFPQNITMIYSHENLPLNITIKNPRRLLTIPRIERMPIVFPSIIIS